MAIFSDRDCYKVRSCLSRLLQRIICIVVELEGCYCEEGVAADLFTLCGKRVHVLVLSQSTFHIGFGLWILELDSDSLILLMTSSILVYKKI